MSNEATWVGGGLSTRPKEDQAKIKADRRKVKRPPGERWQGALTVKESEEQRRRNVIRRVDRRREKRRALAIHFKRRRRGTLTTHHIGRYLSAWEDCTMFLQMTPQLMVLSKNLAMICSLVMLACCRYKADALRAERREIAEWLNVHRDTVTRLTGKLVKLGLLRIEARFIDAKVIGRNGRTLHHPQIGNWYSPGPALRAIWQVVKATGARESYPQAPAGLDAIVQSVAQNNSLDREIDPYRRIGTLGSNSLTSSDKESASRTVVKKPAAPAEIPADKRTGLAGPSTAAPCQPVCSGKNASERAQNASHAEERTRKAPLPATFADTLLAAYVANPEQAEILARAILRATELERVSARGTVRPSG